MKCTTRPKAIARYGKIDFASAHWPGQSKWMKVLDVPDEWFPSWYVLGTKHPVTSIYCNTDLHGPLLRALTEIHKQGLGQHLHTYDGCLSIRMVRGSSSAFSAHAYGCAIDINASENPLGQEPVMHLGIVTCFKAQGFDWGGGFKRKDGMHFSYCWETPVK